MLYEPLGLCAPGGGPSFVESMQWQPNHAGGEVCVQHSATAGQVCVNPSGGLLSKGHPISATGLMQCAELNWQLRGQARKRQVDGARVALQHNFGLGGTCVVTIYGAPATTQPALAARL